MNETILVIDDEPKIVKLARDYLERGGFRVVMDGLGLAVGAPCRDGAGPQRSNRRRE
jgi:CheY-like chemotaxis protein